MDNTTDNANEELTTIDGILRDIKNEIHSLNLTKNSLYRVSDRISSLPMEETCEDKIKKEPVNLVEKLQDITEDIKYVRVELQEINEHLQRHV